MLYSAYHKCNRIFPHVRWRKTQEEPGDVTLGKWRMICRRMPLNLHAPSSSDNSAKKKKKNSSSPLKYSSSSVCHDSYQTVVDICVAIRIATPRKDRKRRARCMKGAILSISGQFFFVASRGPHKAFTSSFSWIVQLHQRWIGLIFQRSHWRKSCSISCPRETITHLDIRWAEPSHRID